MISSCISWNFLSLRIKALFKSFLCWIFLLAQMQQNYEIEIVKKIHSKGEIVLKWCVPPPISENFHILFQTKTNVFLYSLLFLNKFVSTMEISDRTESCLKQHMTLHRSKHQLESSFIISFNLKYLAKSSL